MRALSPARATHAVRLDRESAGATHLPDRQRTNGEGALICLNANVVPATRVHRPRQQHAALARAAPFRHRVRALGQWLCVVWIAVVNAAHAASNVVQYSYDSVGNIVAIQRVSPAPITISGFAPTSGPIGTLVTITGTGYNPTAANNAVTFSGVAGTVVAATVTALTVAVPAGAATGRIAVAAAGNAATSAQDFVVAAPGVPTITGFAPAAGPSAP